MTARRSRKPAGRFAAKPEAPAGRRVNVEGRENVHGAGAKHLEVSLFAGSGMHRKAKRRRKTKDTTRFCSVARGESGKEKKVDSKIQLFAARTLLIGRPFERVSVSRAEMTRKTAENRNVETEKG